MKKSCILGSGSWAHALSTVFSNNDYIVKCRDINKASLTFKSNVQLVERFTLLNDSEYIFLAIPSQTLRKNLIDLKKETSFKKFVFVIPEYNGSFPGVLKAFIDSLDFLKLSGKKAALIGLSSGHAGGLRALDHFTEILHHLKIEVYSDKPKLSGIEKLIDDTQLIDDKSIERLKKMLGNFIEF